MNTFSSIVKSIAMAVYTTIGSHEDCQELSLLRSQITRLQSKSQILHDTKHLCGIGHIYEIQCDDSAGNEA